ncbi:TerC family protein [Paenibacillus arenilitoris]|uniref:TerC family protein n=1 Tax=Paenibacillus arenilitoris TaxID=2772299 RepID=A0A927H709_9BACL|nr:TerC family protein [Paenibacillus arenilitoris]MBD2870153.1 TerC family protein [Paenibacillus arenilitoris]
MDSLLIFIQIVLINVLLSGDNAIVIAMASSHLPPEQRKRAVRWGALAAVALRCLLTVAAVTLLKIPFLQAAGALLLFYIALKLLADARGGHSERQSVKKAGTIGQAVWTIVVADFVMSLDNVLAIAAVAEGDLILILLGIAISIPMIIWGSQLLGSLLNRFPALSYIGAALLAYAAGEMLMHDPGLDKLLFHGSKTLAEAVPLLCVPLVIALAVLKRKPA